MNDRVFTYLGHPFSVSHDLPDEPATNGKYVGDVLSPHNLNLSIDLDESGMWCRVLGLFSSEGECIVACKREIEFMFHTTPK